MAASKKNIFAVLLLAAMQFALAIAGSGGWAAFSSDPQLKALAYATIPLTILALFAGGNMSPGYKEDKRNRWVLWALASIAVANAYLPAYCLHSWTLLLSGYWIRWIGVALYLVGGLFALWPVFVLGDRFSGLVALQPGHKLERLGPYKFVRNPFYLGMLTCMLGWELAFRSEVGLVLICLLFPVLASRMEAEERLLHRYFGSEYDAYHGCTKRLFPGIY